MKNILLLGWPEAKIETRGRHTLAYLNDRLVGMVSLYEKARWGFFHYGFGGWGGVGDVKTALALFRREMKERGWTYATKGGNPLLEGKWEPRDLRDFEVPTRETLDELRDFLLAYLKKRFPEAEVEEMALYAGMAWFLDTKGKDGLGIRDIDVNVFFKTGGPPSVRWITKLRWKLNGKERVIDLYWNTLPKGVLTKEYMMMKYVYAKRGRWLTIPSRPWISLLSGEKIWPGELGG